MIEGDLLTASHHGFDPKDRKVTVAFGFGRDEVGTQTTNGEHRKQLLGHLSPSLPSDAAASCTLIL